MSVKSEFVDEKLNYIYFYKYLLKSHSKQRQSRRLVTEVRPGRSGRISHGRKNRQKQKISHGLTRNEEQTEAEDLAAETKHINQSRMRERRYKYTVWGGPLRQAQGPFSYRAADVNLPVIANQKNRCGP